MYKRQGSGSISGAEEAPENGLPSSMITAPPTAMPARPSSAASPATAELIASAVSENVPATAHQFPGTASSQLWVSPAATAPTRAADPASAATARPPRSPSRVTAAPAPIPARASGSTLVLRTALRGSRAAAGATSSVTTRPCEPSACRATACWSSWATAGLAADAVSSFGPCSVTTTAPYTSRSSTAARAAPSSA